MILPTSVLHQFPLKIPRIVLDLTLPLFLAQGLLIQDLHILLREALQSLVLHLLDINLPNQEEGLPHLLLSIVRNLHLFTIDIIRNGHLGDHYQEDYEGLLLANHSHHHSEVHTTDTNINQEVLFICTILAGDTLHQEANLVVIMTINLDTLTYLCIEIGHL